MKLFGKKEQKGREEPRVITPIPDNTDQARVERLIEALREENKRPKERPVEFRQTPPIVKEWSRITKEEDETGMVRLHHIKLNENFADSVLSGEKSFELRRNDRGYQKGDLIEFEVVNSVGVPVDHPIAGKRYKVTHVGSGWGLQDGIVVLAIREVPKDEAVQ